MSGGYRLSRGKGEIILSKIVTSYNYKLFNLQVGERWMSDILEQEEDDYNDFDDSD